MAEVVIGGGIVQVFNWSARVSSYFVGRGFDSSADFPYFDPFWTQ